jgi:hypothetical protein
VAGLKGEADANGDGYVTGTELGEFLQDNVINYSKGAQHPQYGKIRHPLLDKGDFVFQLPSVDVSVPPPAPAPPGADFSIKDLEERAREEEANKAAWQDWLGKMKGAYQEASEFGKGEGAPGQKAEAWGRFLRAFAEDDPYDQQDEQMRKEAQEQIAAWKREAGRVEQAKVRPEPTQTQAPEGMVWIPGGTFRMGSNDGFSDEKPVHTVSVNGFWMGKYEVTNAEYGKFNPGHSSGSYHGHDLSADDQPVVLVSWWDAIKYCNWRSGQEGLERCYNESTGSCDFSKKGYRLPTEAEWEYAARGGLQGKRYVWGDGSPPPGAANVADETAKAQWSSWTIFEGYDDGYAVRLPVLRQPDEQQHLHRV